MFKSNKLQSQINSITDQIDTARKAVKTYSDYLNTIDLHEFYIDKIKNGDVNLI